MAPGPRLNECQWVVLTLGGVLLLAVVMYPPWYCTSYRYKLSREAILALGQGVVGSKAIPANAPLALDDCGRRVVYCWLFRPPTEFAGRRWEASIDWLRLAPRCLAVAFATSGLLVLLGDAGVVLTLLRRLRGKSGSAS